MLTQLTNHLWQSTIFAVVAGLLTLAFRKNRAQVRFSLWFSASVKFFVPFALLMSLGSYMPARKLAMQIATPSVSFTLEQITEPFAATSPLPRSRRSTRDWVPIAIFSMWAYGFVLIASIRLRAWLRIHALVGGPGVSAWQPAESRRCSIRYVPGLLEPGVIGVFRPILLLPEGISDRLTPAQLEAVLAHELCHIRRRDNLFSSIHMIVEAVFWFHPLVWWIGARLVEERERACDEEVLRLGNEPRVYAEGIVNVCKLYVESPLVCVSGVTGSDLKKRIEAIMANRKAFRLNFARKATLGIAGTIALAVPIAIGILNAPRVRAQSGPPIPKFEAVSIKPCTGEPVAIPGRKGSRGGRLTTSPGRLFAECATLETLVRAAYLQFADGKAPAFISPRIMQQEIKGRPAWYGSDRYTIEAKAEGGPQSREVLLGPMLQALLEDRFKLKIRRESREVPIYELRVGKSGPKLQAANPGSCVVFDRDHPPPEPGPGSRPICGGFFGGNLYGTTMENLSRQLTVILDRDVTDKTGLAGQFDIQFEFPPDDLSPGIPDGGASAPPDPAAFRTKLATNLEAAIPKLGLILKPAKGSGEFLVIDHVEKPSEN